MFALNQLSFQIKFTTVHVNGEIYIANMLCVSFFGVFLSLCSIRAATGSWKKVFKLALKFPPLLVLPSFGFVTFGSTPAGDAAHILQQPSCSVPLHNHHLSPLGRVWLPNRMNFRKNCKRPLIAPPLFLENYIAIFPQWIWLHIFKQARGPDSMKCIHMPSSKCVLFDFSVC